MEMDKEIESALNRYDITGAQNLLRTALSQNPTAQTYFLGSRLAVDTRQKLYFLQEALKRDPFHKEAYEELARLNARDNMAPPPYSLEQSQSLKDTPTAPFNSNLPGQVTVQTTQQPGKIESNSNYPAQHNSWLFDGTATTSKPIQFKNGSNKNLLAGGLIGLALIILVVIFIIFSSANTGTSAAYTATALSSITAVPTSIPARKPLRTYESHTSWVHSVAFSPDGKMFVSGSGDKTVKLWDVASGNLMATFSGHSEAVLTVAFSPDGKILASGSEDKTINLWDVTTGTLLKTLTGHSGYVEAVVFSPDGKILASGGGAFDSRINLWDVGSGNLLNTFSSYGYVLSLAFSPDSSLLASGAVNGTVTLWRLASNSVLKTLAGHDSNQGDVNSVAFSPDGKILASGSKDQNIILWEIPSGKPLITIHDKDYVNRVLAVAFSQDGKILASGTSSGTVKFWDTSNGQLLTTTTRQSIGANSIAFNPDGKTLVCGYDNGTIVLWQFDL